MRPRRITATSRFWRYQLPPVEDQDRTQTETGNKFIAKALPSHTKVPLDSFDASMAENMCVWLRKHGRVRDPAQICQPEAATIYVLVEGVNQERSLCAGAKTKAVCRAEQAVAAMLQV